MERFRPLGWRADTLCSPAKSSMHGIREAVRTTRFPFRLLRYWFVHELLVDEGRRRGDASLQVAEVGIDRGQMLDFTRQTLAWRGEAQPWQHWHGLDCSPPTDSLRQIGYDALTQIELEDRAQMAAQPHQAYDVIIVLHVLEHLFEPERELAEMARWLRPGGIIIGGCPGTPEFARDRWQRRLRRHAQPRGHVSVISSSLVRQWGAQLGLHSELLSGAFFMRKTGFALENHAWWLKANLAFGAACPAWPGELYWCWRKPAADLAPH